MKNGLAFILSLFILFAIHEGMHAWMASLYGEYQSFHIKPLGFEVEYKTPPAERSGTHWAFISGLSNMITIMLGYLLLVVGRRLASILNVYWRTIFFYLTLLCLIVDPLNLSIGPFIYGGDVYGIAAGLHINRWIIQAIFLVVLLVNRELVGQKLFSIYNVPAKHILFKPIICRAHRIEKAMP